MNKTKLELRGSLIANHVTAMLAYWDKNLICRYANKAYVDWFGVKPEEMINNVTIKELLGDLFQKNLPYIEGVLAGHEQTFEREIKTPNMGTRYSIANYSPDIAADGEVKGFYVHVADITPLKVFERDLQQASELILEQNKKLINFSNVVSHDLKTYASNFASLLLLYDNADTEGDKTLFLDYLHKLSEQFSSTVTHLTDLAREVGSRRPLMQSINLYQCIENITGALKGLIVKTNADIVNQVPENLTVTANEAYLDSILQNLLTNAIKYRQLQRPLRVDISARQQDDSIFIQVTDNGLGIDLDKHGSDLFGRNQTFHGNADAQGMGLFITKFQVEAMGGSIWAKSKINEGSVFTVMLKAGDVL